MVEFSPDELALLREKVVVGASVDPVPKIPDAPDISEEVKAEDVPPEPVTNGLVELKSSERPVVGQHFVVWGNEFFNDIHARPVKRRAVSEDEYAAKMRKEAEWLVTGGLKDPDPNLDERYLRSRADRAEQYARWRYKGFVCGEVASL